MVDQVAENEHRAALTAGERVGVVEQLTEPDGQPMPGVLEVGHGVPTRQAIDDVLLLASCSLPGEWEGQVRYIPLR